VNYMSWNAWGALRIPVFAHLLRVRACAGHSEVAVTEREGMRPEWLSNSPDNGLRFSPPTASSQ